MHKDFKDLLSAFNAHSVRYLIVGGYAYARYTEPRTTNLIANKLAAGRPQDLLDVDKLRHASQTRKRAPRT
jgi:hypothetical protein